MIRRASPTLPSSPFFGNPIDWSSARHQATTSSRSRLRHGQASSAISIPGIHKSDRRPSGSRTAQRKSPAKAGLSLQEEPSNVTFTINAHKTSAADCTRDVMAITKMRFLGRAAPTRTCGMTDGIVRCTSMQRPRRVAWQRNGWRTVKGPFACSAWMNNVPLKAPSGVARGISEPRSAPARNHAWAGFSLARRQRGCPTAKPRLGATAAGRCVQIPKGRESHQASRNISRSLPGGFPRERRAGAHRRKPYAET